MAEGITMSEDFYTASARQRLERIEAERAAATADLQAHRANSDYESAGYAIQQIADLDRQRENVIGLYNRHVAHQTPPQRYVSDEQRAARVPGELDAYDLAKISGISPEEYMRQYQRLAHYKATRGDERK